MRKTYWIFFACSTLAATPALALVFGGSNLGIFGYPDHTCSKPYKPYSFTAQWEVDQFNSELTAYYSCIDEYVENAKNDIDRIIEKANEAVDDVNSRY